MLAFLDWSWWSWIWIIYLLYWMGKLAVKNPGATRGLFSILVGLIGRK